MTVSVHSHNCENDTCVGWITLYHLPSVTSYTCVLALREWLKFPRAAMQVSIQSTPHPHKVRFHVNMAVSSTHYAYTLLIICIVQIVKISLKLSCQITLSIKTKHCTASSPSVHPVTRTNMQKVPISFIFHHFQSVPSWLVNLIKTKRLVVVVLKNYIPYVHFVHISFNFPSFSIGFQNELYILSRQRDWLWSHIHTVSGWWDTCLWMLIQFLLYASFICW